MALISGWQNRAARLEGVVGRREDDTPGSAVHVIGSGNIDLRSICREVLFLPETVSVQQALRQFQQAHTHMAMVVDEYGATQGIVTLEDAIEEFVGESDDEFDQTAPPTFGAEAGRYRVGGLYPMRDLCERLKMADPSDPQIDTLNGHVTHELGRFPTVGDEVALGPYFVRVSSIHRKRVRQAIIERRTGNTNNEWRMANNEWQALKANWRLTSHRRLHASPETSALAALPRRSAGAATGDVRRRR